MKKLMIAAAAMMVVVGANAAEALWNWSTAGSGTKSVVYAEGATDTKLYASAGQVMFYLFDTANYSQQDILDGLRGDKTLADFTPAKTTLLTSDSKIDEAGSGDGFKYGTDSKSYNFFMAALVNDQLLLSDNIFDVAVQGNSFNAEEIAFNNVKAWSNTESFGTAAFDGAGWYATAVPEPTSGLLLLLGVAGLALRRRRA